MNAHTKTFDVEKVRADFPILSKEVYGKKLVYLDNAASAQKPTQVLDRMVYAYEHEYANVHRGLHYLANAATEAFEHARETVRAFINAASTDEIIFTRNATEAMNLVAASLGRMVLNPGDEIILSMMEHHSNIVPWHFHRERNGAVIKWIPCDERGVLDLDAYEKLFTPKTKIVAISQMSNVLGTINPIAEMVKIARKHGAYIMVDGCQGAVHVPTDVRALDVDFYCLTGHKLYGPTGIGVAYGKRALLEEMPPFNGGGEMISVVTEDSVTYNEPPHRFEAGTPPIVQAIGLGAALDYMQSMDRSAALKHEESLGQYAMERLSELNSIRIFGTAPGKGAIVAFEMQGAHAHDVATIIDRSGIAVRAGTHCAQPLLKRFGVTSTCRASFAFYNTHAEVDALVDALRKAQSMFS
ncbi:MAG: cysteine desulfurase [Alphaproteobacteria bacterium]|nr:cysteine desulfurase [Alphaproteobacteria bacterium]